MRRDPGIALAIAILALAAATAIWLLSGTWLVHGSTYQEASSEFPCSVSDMQPTADRVRQLMASTFLIRTERDPELPAVKEGWLYQHEAGAGVALSEHEVLTGEHVVTSARTVTITACDGFKQEVQVVWSDPVADLALLDTGIGNSPVDRQLSPLPIRLRPLVAQYGIAEISAGEAVSTIGTPDTDNWRFSTGAVQMMTVEPWGSSLPLLFANVPEGETRVFGGHGSSGGPIVDADNCVVGIVTHTSPNGGLFFRPITLFCEFYDCSGFTLQ